MLESRQALVVGAVAAMVGCGSTNPGGSPTGPGTGGGGGEPSSTSGSGPSGGSGPTGGGGSGGGGSGGSEPLAPAELVHYVTGSDADAAVTPAGPALVLMGGGTDVDAAFSWWGTYVAGGDVVVLRTSGADGYNDYLFSDFDAVDSVETLLVTSAALANDPYVAWRVRHAEGVFMAGGDQAAYLTFWKDTALEDALSDAWDRGAVIGGTSAGCAVLGAFVFAAYNDTVYSDEALDDPYNRYMQLDRDFLALPPLARVVTDTHFRERDRFGRLIGFVARVVQDGWSPNPIGIGVDEATALLVDPAGIGEVVGDGSVYVVHANGAPQQCQANATLEYAALSYHALVAGDTVTLPMGTSSAPSAVISASGGVTSPADPY